MNPIRVLAHRLLILGTLGFFMGCAAVGALATNLFPLGLNVCLCMIVGMGAGMALVGYLGWVSAQRLSEEIKL